jgi:glucuronide carrier protein
MFLLLYYTDVVGLAATTVGTLFLVVRVFDGLADLFAGRLVDKTSPATTSC